MVWQEMEQEILHEEESRSKVELEERKIEYA